MSMTLEHAFEVAINDAINIYVRKVLVTKGYIIPEKADDLWKPVLLNAKYEIARKLAQEWGRMRLQVKVLGINEEPEPYIPVQSFINEGKEGKERIELTKQESS